MEQKKKYMTDVKVAYTLRQDRAQGEYNNTGNMGNTENRENEKGTEGTEQTTF